MDRSHRHASIIRLVVVMTLLYLGAQFFFGASSSREASNSSLAAVVPALSLEPAPIPTLATTPKSAVVQVQTAALVDVESGAVLYSEEPQREVPIASTTKLMTALVARQLLDLQHVVAITVDDTSIIGSDMGLRPGEKITVRNLLAGLLITSGNDAAQALAHAASGSTEAFVAAMTEKAQELGLQHTLFKDPAGLDDDGYSTAYELSIIARAALLDPVIAEFVRTAEMTVWSTNQQTRHDLTNSNRLVTDYQYLGVLGLKTGFTPEAGHCLVAAAKRDGHTLIGVVLHTDADTITASAEEARKLLDWGWANYRWPS